MISKSIEKESLLDICCHLDVARDGVSPRPRRAPVPPPSSSSSWPIKRVHARAHWLPFASIIMPQSIPTTRARTAVQTAQGRVGLALFVTDMGGGVPHLHLKDYCLHMSLYPHGGETSEAHFEAVSHLAPIYRSLPVAPIFSCTPAPVRARAFELFFRLLPA